jgi:hypothetical protein
MKEFKSICLMQEEKEKYRHRHATNKWPRRVLLKLRRVLLQLRRVLQ